MELRWAERTGSATAAKPNKDRRQTQEPQYMFVADTQEGGGVFREMLTKNGPALRNGQDGDDPTLRLARSWCCREVSVPAKLGLSLLTSALCPKRSVSFQHF